MVFDGELLNLILYCVQQAGVSLGFGAQTVMLVAYLRAAKDGIVDDKESQFLRATHGALFAALALIITSGVGITALHAASEQGAVLMSPAYLFKWVLIILVLGLTLAWKVVPQKINEALLGGAWYALFLVHILAPVASWIDLLTLAGAWMIGFALVWTALVVIIKDKSATPEEKPKAPTPPPVAPAPTPQPIILPTKLGGDVPKPTIAPFVKLDPPKKDFPVVPLVPPPVAAPVAKSTPQVVPTVPASPAQRVTDKPFLPQVPPLEPIVVTPPAAPAPNAPVAGAGIPPNPKDAPKLQQPETIATAVPQDGLSHVQVMPKSPEQLK